MLRCSVDPCTGIQPRSPQQIHVSILPAMTPMDTGKELATLKHLKLWAAMARFLKPQIPRAFEQRLEVHDVEICLHSLSAKAILQSFRSSVQVCSRKTFATVLTWIRREPNSEKFYFSMLNETVCSQPPFSGARPDSTCKIQPESIMAILLLRVMRSWILVRLGTCSWLGPAGRSHALRV